MKNVFSKHALSNLKQIGVAIELYKQDNESRFPTTTGQNWTSYRLGGDDADPDYRSRFSFESAANRPLWQYTSSRKLYRCPADRGLNWSPWMQPFSNTYEKAGTSYMYNTCLWSDREPTRLPQKDPGKGLEGKKENWLSDPSRYVLLHEPPASPQMGDGTYYFFWHYARGPNTVFSLRNAKDRFISPILFADGHTKVHDFTKVIRLNPSYPHEPTADWYWYEPAEGAR